MCGRTEALNELWGGSRYGGGSAAVAARVGGGGGEEEERGVVGVGTTWPLYGGVGVGAVAVV